MFSHAIPCQGGVTQAHRESVRGCWGGWLRLESKLVCWDGCDHVGDEGTCEGVLALEGGCCLDSCKINILWTLPLH